MSGGVGGLTRRLSHGGGGDWSGDESGATSAPPPVHEPLAQGAGLRRRRAARRSLKRLLVWSLAWVLAGAGSSASAVGASAPYEGAPGFAPQPSAYGGFGAGFGVAGGGGGRIAGTWRVLPMPEAPLEGRIVFYDRQFEGGAGCGRFSGAFDRMEPWFRVRDLHLEGRCEIEADLLDRLERVTRLTRRGAVMELSDGMGRVLLRLTPY